MIFDRMEIKKGRAVTKDVEEVFTGIGTVVKDLGHVESAMIELFADDKKIKDHEDFHALAEGLGWEPSKLEEKAYALLQSFFAQGYFMKAGQGKEFDSKEVEMGKKVELEHTNNPIIALRITLDHLTEIPDYYTRLAQMEIEGKKAMKEGN